MARVPIWEALERLETTRVTITKWILQRKLKAYWKRDKKRWIIYREFAESDIKRLESKNKKKPK